MASDCRYLLPCAPSEVQDFVERELVPSLFGLGYVVDARGEREITLLGMRRPPWAIALCVFLFPVGLAALLVKRPRELRLRWEGSQLDVLGNDSSARHLVARFATARELRPSIVETAAPGFVAGACCVAIAWLASVQFLDAATDFAAAVVAAALVGCGIGTLIGFRRAAASGDPRNPILWGTLPALAGAAFAAGSFTLLVAGLCVAGACD